MTSCSDDTKRKIKEAAKLCQDHTFMCWADKFLSGKDTTQESASQVLHHMETHIPKRASWVSRHAWVRGAVDRNRGDKLAIEALYEIKT